MRRRGWEEGKKKKTEGEGRDERNKKEGKKKKRGGGKEKEEEKREGVSRCPCVLSVLMAAFLKFYTSLHLKCFYVIP